MSTPSDNTSSENTATPAAERTAEKDPSEWVTGGEPPTGPQLSYLSTLAHEAGSEAPNAEDLTKAQASEEIERLQAETGRGAS